VPIVECVPNFSEGRDPAKVEAIQNAIVTTPGVVLLRTEQDPDHNRSVITFAGEPQPVLEAAFYGIREAVNSIDLNKHAGVHPRIGAADVTPFIPIDGVTLDDCVQLAHSLGERVWRDLNVPVYFYEAAARNPERIALENVRRGGFEKPALRPDLGGPALHPTAGACVIGARHFLIAFNINLLTPDIQIARSIALTIRASSGGLPFVKAIGVRLESRNLAQVSMNLTNFEQTPIHVVFERVKKEAAEYGVEIAGSEIIGLIPKKALEMTLEHYLQVENFSSTLVLENQLLSLL
jgi:glutamate formiminotransferase